MGNLFKFGEVIEALKQGKRAARQGWNGKGMFVFKQIPSNIDNSIVPKMQSVPDSVKKVIAETGDNLSYENQMAIVNAGRVDSWVPSSSDIFAEDWMIFED